MMRRKRNNRAFRLRASRAQSPVHVLNEAHPAQTDILKTFAGHEIPEKADLPLDQLATVVALRLMDISDEEPGG
jgi:hypothetical protein